VALQDVVASVAGAFSIGFSKLYPVGDHVQIGDTLRENRKAPTSLISRLFIFPFFFLTY
jgi:small-conductance mechanosensitive channel